MPIHGYLKTLRPFVKRLFKRSKSKNPAAGLHVTPTGQLTQIKHTGIEGNDWIDQRLYDIWLNRDTNKVAYIKEIARITANYVINRAQGLTLTFREQQMLDAWLNDSQENQGIFRKTTDPDQLRADLEELEFIQTRTPERWKKLEAMIETNEAIKRMGQPPSIPVRRIRNIVMVLLAAGFLVFGSYLMLKTNHNKPEQHAILFFPDGKTFALDQLPSNKYIKYNGYTFEKPSPNRLTFLSSMPKSAVSIQTFAGCSYSLTLGDGSDVSMNDSTRITISGSDHNREVSILGEAYFNVAHSSLHPFTVHTPDDVIKVLGTQFNVKAYFNEPTLTTLVDGAVRVSDSAQKNTVVLAPGQQVQKMMDSSFHISNAAYENTNWLRGRFAFHDLYGAMREISRCYGVSVIYKGNVPNRTLIADPYKNSSILAVLAAISNFGIHLQYSGTRIIIEA